MGYNVKIHDCTSVNRGSGKACLKSDIFFYLTSVIECTR